MDIISRLWILYDKLRIYHPSFTNEPPVASPCVACCTFGSATCVAFAIRSLRSIDICRASTAATSDGDGTAASRASTTLQRPVPEILSRKKGDKNRENEAENGGFLREIGRIWMF